MALFQLFAPVFMTGDQLKSAFLRFVIETKPGTKVTFTEAMGTARGGVGEAMNLLVHINGSEGGLVFFSARAGRLGLSVEDMYEVMFLAVNTEEPVVLNGETVQIANSSAFRGEIDMHMGSEFRDEFQRWVISAFPK